MFHNLKYLTVLVVVALPLAVDAEQRGRGQRGRGGQQQQQPQSGQRQQLPPPSQPPPATAQPPLGYQHQQKFRSPRAEALAPPAQLAQALLPAGARRVNERVAPPQQGVNPWLYGQRPRGQHHRWFNKYPYASYYAVPYGGYSYYETAPQEEPAPPPPAVAATNKGLLQLDIVPSTGLDYYIDGIHVGSSAQLGSEFEVNAGARQIEIRARGYKPATFDLRIDEGRVTTVRATLEAVEQPQPPRAAAGQVLYLIPGCYMGNSKPAASALPPGCDIKKMVTRGGL
jgi:hypothetical protein